MIRTSSPIAASAVPRLIAVVVLPTPPFWLATASTRGALADRASVSRSGVGKAIRLAAWSFDASSLMAADPFVLSGLSVRSLQLRLISSAPGRSNDRFDALHDDYSALRVGSTRREAGLNLPIFSGLGQFVGNILSLRKQSAGAFFQQRIGRRQKLGKRRQGARGDDIDRFRRVFHEFLDPNRVHDGRSAGHACRLLQERRLLLFAFDQVHRRSGRFGQRAGDNQSGKAAAGAEIDPGARQRRRQRQKLQRIGHVPGPQMRLRRGGNQIHPALPVAERGDEIVEPPECFT